MIVYSKEVTSGPYQTYPLTILNLPLRIAFFTTSPLHDITSKPLSLLFKQQPMHYPYYAPEEKLAQLPESNSTRVTSHTHPRSTQPARTYTTGDMLVERMLAHLELDSDDRAQPDSNEEELFPGEVQGARGEQETAELIVELDQNNVQTLLIGRQDEPVLLATQFCYLHNIDPKIIVHFARQIKQVQLNNWGASALSTHEQSAQHERSLKGGDRSYADASQVRHRENTYSYSSTCSEESRGVQSGMNVFQRLYRQNLSRAARHRDAKEEGKSNVEGKFNKKVAAQRRKNTEKPDEWTKQSMVNQSTTFLQSTFKQNEPNQLNTSYCHKIYQKNTRLKTQSQIKNFTVKKQLQLMEIEQCKPTPAINPLSRLIVQKMRQCGHGDQNSALSLEKTKSYERLYQHAQKSREKKSRLILDNICHKQIEELQQCSFYPNHHSTKNLHERKIKTERHLILYEDSNLRKFKADSLKKKLINNETLRQVPSINNISKKLVKKPFEERLKDYETKRQRTLDRLSREKAAQYKATPSINKNARNNKQKSVEIGEYLYSKSLQNSRTRQPQKPVNAFHPIKNSQKIFNELKTNSFRYIFTVLDSDEDGLISSLKINILGLQTPVLSLIAPLLSQMQEAGIELDEQLFVQSLDRLFNTFSPDEKNKLINVYKNPDSRYYTIEQPSFRPSLNERSIEMVRESRSRVGSLYDQAKDKELEREAKLNELRALKAMMELQQCTFQPNMIYNH